jgi:2-polyprenyl-3-methyl-5-hydroxy-6-metoxy-1,4-benzoquinol methylase
MLDSTPKTTTDFWDAQWGERGSRDTLSAWLHRDDFGKNGPFLRLMDRHMPNLFEGARVCELGGASSKFLVDLALYRGAVVTAVDYSPIGIEQTKALFAAHAIDGEVIFADMFNWTGEKEQFDVVTHWGLLEHFDNPLPTLAASANLIKPGGALVFAMPNMAAVGSGFWRRLAPTNFAAHIYHTDESIKEACANAGLNLERTFYSGPPLLRLSPPERLGVLSRLVDAMHLLSLFVGKAFPSLFLRGHARISNTRNFLATKPMDQAILSS